MTDKLLSDEELKQELRSQIEAYTRNISVLGKKNSGYSVSAQNQEKSLCDYLEFVINTQKRLYAESVIGEDVPNDGGEIVRSTSGEVKGRGAGSYYLQAQRELRAEQRGRIK